MLKPLDLSICIPLGGKAVENSLTLILLFHILRFENFMQKKTVLQILTRHYCIRMCSWE